MKQAFIIFTILFYFSSIVLSQECLNILGSIVPLFNAFFFGDFNEENTEISGRLAAKGNIDLYSGFSIAESLSNVQCSSSLPSIYESIIIFII